MKLTGAAAPAREYYGLNEMEEEPEIGNLLKMNKGNLWHTAETQNYCRYIELTFFSKRM
jgi:hypothetical protein